VALVFVAREVAVPAVAAAAFVFLAAAMPEVEFPVRLATVR